MASTKIFLLTSKFSACILLCSTLNFQHTIAFSASPIKSRVPAMLPGRSAPTRPVGEIPELRMKLAMNALPKGFGIDPTTGQLCAGDPSLILNTNVKMGDKKKAFMAAASKALASALGKPESYVAISVSDGQDMIFGGTDAPCALACCYSLGAINQANNKAVTAKITSLLSDFGVSSTRIYINFFDVPASNIGYGGATFAG